MTDPTQAETPDFTIRRAPIAFIIDDDTFRAPPIIAAVNLAKIASMHKGLSFDTSSPEGIEAMLSTIGEMFKILLPGASGQRFAARLLADGGDEATPPIDITQQALPALYYMLERYGLRPTGQSSLLPSAAMTGDLMAGAQAEASTGEASATPLDS